VVRDRARANRQPLIAEALNSLSMPDLMDEQEPAHELIL
jgi:hypothetical protein